ncbi:hypothetical protein FGKAn22_23350 [Ferrigenium kumadai]|uniref:Uncharacterized protein n=2 Tax=Ferrigenium kumadai TaxID=1682490 RepID=A0AAN1T193_9PROT|nr:hypothetical protein FGKAn22_23350 [Ferrigenium kumadai]
MHNADDTWGVAPRPLASLLKAFLVAAGGGPIDPRLGLDTAFRACGLIETTASSYQAAVLPWVTEALAAGVTVDGSLRYALRELLEAEGPLTTGDLEAQIARLRARFRVLQSVDELQALPNVIRACAKG